MDRVRNDLFRKDTSLSVGQVLSSKPEARPPVVEACWASAFGDKTDVDVPP
jgi:hypothetical protein